MWLRCPRIAFFYRYEIMLRMTSVCATLLRDTIGRRIAQFLQRQSPIITFMHGDSADLEAVSD